MSPWMETTLDFVPVGVDCHRPFSAIVFNNAAEVAANSSGNLRRFSSYIRFLRRESFCPEVRKPNKKGDCAGSSVTHFQMQGSIHFFIVPILCQHRAELMLVIPHQILCTLPSAWHCQRLKVKAVLNILYEMHNFQTARGKRRR